MLGRLQQQLSDTYQAEHGYDVRDFLITDRRLAQAISGETTPEGGATVPPGSTTPPPPEPEPEEPISDQ